MRTSACVAVVVSAAACHAEIDYQVTAKPAEKLFAVEITFPVQAGATSLQIPNWEPGDTSQYPFYKDIQGLVATDDKGAPLKVSHPDDDTWTVWPEHKGSVKVTYNVSTAKTAEHALVPYADNMQLQGPWTYLYVVGRQDEPCRIRFDLPSGWQMAVGLEAKGGPNTFVAPNYDVLADNPVSMGNDLHFYSFKAAGKDHEVVLEGPTQNQVDRPALLAFCRTISAGADDFFGGAPYHKYLWQFPVEKGEDGGGGVEHSSSVLFSLAAGVGIESQHVIAHEFFHLWNSKRIRPKGFGPFDYQKMPTTGHYWFIEGVTEYYSTLLPYRYGAWKRSDFLDHLYWYIVDVRASSARVKTSLYESGLMVTDPTLKGPFMEYYAAGYVCGMCLDCEIRAQTHGKHSLDDVMRAMYDVCKNGKPGFEEGEIRKQLVRIGGPALGPFYDQVVMKPGAFPVDQQLAKVGLRIENHEQEYTDIGFNTLDSLAHGLQVGGVFGPAEGKLLLNDTILAINGDAVSQDNVSKAFGAFHELENKAVPGTPFTLDILRNGKSMKVQIVPVVANRATGSIVNDPSASPEAVALREGWLMTKRAKYSSRDRVRGREESLGVRGRVRVFLRRGAGTYRVVFGHVDRRVSADSQENRSSLNPQPTS